MKFKKTKSKIRNNDHSKYYVLVTLCLLLFVSSVRAQFIHPGILHTDDSFEYMQDQVNNRVQPAFGSYEKLKSNSLSSSRYKMKGPYAEIGRSRECPNNGSSSDDFIAAYRNALMWKITGNEAHAKKAEEILLAYANTLKIICSRDDALLVGLRGFIFVNAAEILRDYMSASNLEKVKTMFSTIFVPVCQKFFNRKHFSNGNWGASVCKGAMAYGIFTDNQELYDFAKDWYFNGNDNGVLKHYVDNKDGQNQESGRDQQHSMLGIGCLADTAEVAFNQGDDLYSGYNGDNRLLKGFEYVAKYNLGNDVPYYTWDDLTGKYDDWRTISSEGRGKFRTIFEMTYNHYVSRLGMSMPWTKAVLEEIRPEGNPAWADHTGYGSLLFTYHEEISCDNAPGLNLPPGHEQGIRYSYYEGTWDKLPNFDALTAVKKGFSSSIDISGAAAIDYFGYVFDGYINIPVDGRYTFYTKSDDGSQLLIDGRQIVDNDGLHGAIEKSGSICLEAGYHEIIVEYFEKSGGNSLEVSYAGPGIPKTTDLNLLGDSVLLSTSNPLDRDNINIYPNPVSNILHIDMINTDFSAYTIYTINGKAIESSSIKSDMEKVEINMKAFSTGIYLLKLEARQSSQIFKIVRD